MANPFSNIPQGKNVVRRNNWDWSHDNHLTTKLGAITPVFCQKVPPNTSLSISPRFGLKFMPMVFPVQNNIKARISFFKVPLRALWKDYQNWVSSVNTEQHSKYVPPFFEVPEMDGISVYDLVGTGSLGDYLGLPTDYDSGYSFNQVFSTGNSYPFITKPLVNGDVSTLSSSANNAVGWVYKPTVKLGNPIASLNRISCTLQNIDEISVTSIQLVITDSSTAGPNIHVTNLVDLDYTITANTIRINQSLDNIKTTFYDSFNSPMIVVNGVFSGTPVPLRAQVYFDSSDFKKYSLPWYSKTNSTGLKLSSYPWRAYNAIYNAYYRNIRNNPLKSYVDGSPIYNDYVIPYSYGGSELVNAQKSDISSSANVIQYLKDFFGIRYANWQLDAFTSAVASPQQGNAPLVGLTNTASVVTNQDGTQTATLNSYLTDEDGKTYKVLYNTDKEGLKSVEYLEQPVDGQIMPTAYAAVSQGISIADLRNVNAYTRYLELNMRRGYRYKDIVEGRFDVNVRYDELLMPEFCGGFTRSFDISPITQTVQTVPDGTTYSGALGSQAGDGICFGASDNRIKVYCDEESIVMGLLTVTPEPIYSQILPKFFLDRDILDSFNPEFNALGFQPILNAEVAPIQAFKNGGMDSVNKTFGYQRPYYNLVSLPNVAHGDFRGSLRNFIMNRTFDGVPQLGTDFAVINPNDVNDVFNVQENSDKIFGVVKFDITCKNGVSKSSVPRLE